MFLRGPYECSHAGLKVREFRQHIEGNRPRWQCFPDQVDAVIRAVAEKMRGPIEMPHAIGVEAHQARTSEVRGDRIVGENDFSEVPMSSVQRPVSLHGNDTVSDDEVHWCRRTDIENAPMDAVPVQNILGPAVFHARYDAEHVFHAECDAGPVVGLDLRHRR